MIYTRVSVDLEAKGLTLNGGKTFTVHNNAHDDTSYIQQCSCEFKSI